MKSFKMKALAVAVLGLAGVGSAMAVCPTATISGANGAVTLAPWSGGFAVPFTAPVNGASAATFTISTPGLATTSCKLTVALGSAGAASPAPGNARSFVTYSGDSSDEPRFRARFYVDTTNQAQGLAANSQAPAFVYNTTTSPAGLSSLAAQVQLALGATPRFNFIAQDGSGVFKQSGNIVLPAYGVNVVEIDLSRDGTACAGNANNVATNNFRYWVTDTSGVIVAGSPLNAGVAADDTHPSGTLCVNGAGWSGAPAWQVGINGGATSAYKHAAAANTDASAFQLHFDEFDSRRQTYIGK